MRLLALLQLEGHAAQRRRRNSRVRARVEQLPRRASGLQLDERIGDRPVTIDAVDHTRYHRH